MSHPNLDNMLNQHYTQTYAAKASPRRRTCRTCRTYRTCREPLIVDLLVALAVALFLYWMCQ